MPRHIAAILLAAGLSRRMGSPKALLKLGEKSMLEIALEAMRAAQPGEIIVVASPVVEETLRNESGLRVIRNDEPDRGQLHSLKLALRELSNVECDGAAVLLLDNPEEAQARLLRVLEAAAKQPSAVIAAAWNGERGHPIYLPKTIWSEILGYAGDGGLRGFLDGAGEQVALVESSPAAIVDIDTPADYEKLRNRLPG